MNSSSLGLDEELQVLQSIYLDGELTVTEEQGTTRIDTTLHPSTADNADQKFVCLAICFWITADYPDVVPEFEVSQPRGLSEAHLCSIVDNLKALMNQLVGETMLYQLLEYVRESLTDNNKPSCGCAICLDNFKCDDEFLRTDCYHYYHTACFAAYVKSIDDLDKERNEKVVCPICRVEVKPDRTKLEGALSNRATSVEPLEKQQLTFSDDYKGWRRRCAVTYKRQQRAGGIIDVEAEQNRFLIDSSTVIIGDGGAAASRDSVAEVADAVKKMEQTTIRNEPDKMQKTSEENKRHRRRHKKSHANDDGKRNGAQSKESKDKKPSTNPSRQSERDKPRFHERKNKLKADANDEGLEQTSRDKTRRDSNKSAPARTKGSDAQQAKGTDTVAASKPPARTIRPPPGFENAPL